MKKNMRVILIVAAAMAAVGAIFAVAAFVMGANTSVYWDSGFRVAERDSYAFDEYLDAFDSIDIDMDAADVVIKAGDSFRIEGCYYSKSEKITYNVENGVLQIAGGKTENRFWISNFSFFFGPDRDSYVTVYIPENTQLQSLDLKVDMGGVTVSGIDADGFTASMNLGDFTIRDAILNSLAVETSAGSVTVSKTTAERFTADLDLGDLDMADSVLNNAHIDCNTGAIAGENTSIDNGNITTDMGDIALSGALTGAIDIYNNMGSMTLNVDGYKNEYAYSGNVDLGDIEIDGQSQRNAVEQMVENALGVINFELSLGDAEINFTK